MHLDTVERTRRELLIVSCFSPDRMWALSLDRVDRIAYEHDEYGALPNGERVRKACLPYPPNRSPRAFVWRQRTRLAVDRAGPEPVGAKIEPRAPFCRVREPDLAARAALGLGYQEVDRKPESLQKGPITTPPTRRAIGRGRR